jgi:hypothetical protein
MAEERNPVEKEKYEHYGTRWWDFEVHRQEDTVLQVNGDSAWSPPTPLMLMISSDYEVKVTISFSESGCDFAGVHIYDKGIIEQEHDTSYAQYVYDEQDGIDSLINDYLYDEERYKHFENPDNFITSLGVEGVTSEDMEILDRNFKENLPPMLNKQQTLEDIAEVLQSLKHLSMNGLAAKVEHIHTVLSNEWKEDLKPKKDEQGILVE